MSSSARCDVKMEQVPAQIASESPRASALDLMPDVLDGSDEAHLPLGRGADLAAIEQLVGRYERRLFRLAQNITGNHEDAEECVQNDVVGPHRPERGFNEDPKTALHTELSVDAALNDAEDEDHLIAYQLKDWGPNPEESYSQEGLHRILASQSVTSIRHIASSSSSAI